MNIIFEKIKFYFYLILFGLILYYILSTIPYIVHRYEYDVTLMNFCEKSCKNEEFIGVDSIDYENGLCFCTKRPENVIKYYYVCSNIKNERFQYKFSNCDKSYALGLFNENLAKYYINLFNNKKKPKGVPLWIHGNDFFLEIENE
jgi:hypothetical protein